MKNEERVAAVLLLFALMLLVIHLSSNDMEFSRYNGGWNGTSAFFSSLDRHRVGMVSLPEELLEERSNATLLLIAPERDPTPEEINAYRAFLDRGNTLFLADDFGTGNRILAGLSSRITVRPGPLASLDREYADPYSVVVYSLGNGSLIDGTLLLNAPAALEGGTPLVRTSTFSWIDGDHDQHFGRDEALGIFTVMAQEQNGQGTLVVLSDPSIFINAMADAGPGENHRFLLSLQERGGPLLVDQMNSRTRNAGGLGELLHIIKTTVLLEVLVCGVALLLLAGAFRSRRI